MTLVALVVPECSQSCEEVMSLDTIWPDLGMPALSWLPGREGQWNGLQPREEASILDSLSPELEEQGRVLRDLLRLWGLI